MHGQVSEASSKALPSIYPSMGVSRLQQDIYRKYKQDDLRAESALHSQSAPTGLLAATAHEATDHQ